MSDWHNEFAPSVNLPTMSERVEATIKNILEHLSSYEHPKQMSIICDAEYFHKFIRAVRQKTKRQWREQRKGLVGVISKSDWMESKGLRKEWQ